MRVMRHAPTRAAAAKERRRPENQRKVARTMSSKLANKASHPSGRKAMQAVRASHKEERMKMHKLGEGRRSAQPTFASAFRCM